MSQLKDIKNRIDSVKKTRKMTQAMKMVAASKFKRFSEKAVSSRSVIGDLDLYISQVVHQLNGLVEGEFFNAYDSDTELIVFVSGDRGLCGGFNSSIIKYLKQYISQSNSKIKMIILGKKGIQAFKNDSNVEILKGFENFQDTLSIDSVNMLLNLIKDQYKTGQYKSVQLFYNEFVSAITSNVINKQLFPIEWSSKDVVNEDIEMILEPNIDQVLNQLTVMFVFNVVYNSFLESFAAEQGARMAAMDAATDNAGEMIKDLTLIYNRKRQAQITTELSEIVAGAEALVG